jgi:uncharacterized membrane protein YecN with MAPEG domain
MIAPYAAILGLLFVVLSVRTILARRRLRIAIGDAGDGTMLRAMRVHSNFAEYVPISLLLVYFAELSGARPVLVHVLGCCLVAGRLLHAYGVSKTREVLIYRQAGMLLTFAVILLSAGFLLTHFVLGSAKG